MVNLYVSLIRKGLWTLDRVPEPWHAAVEAELAEEK